MTENPQSTDVFQDIRQAEDRSQAVHTAVGAASVCWERMEGTGLFDSTRAKGIADALLEFLDNERSQQAQVDETSARLQAKIEAEPPEPWSHDEFLTHPGPARRWRQLEDGTYVSDAIPGPPLTVVVERRTPADLPFIYLIGRTQEISPDSARWLANRLLEATAIVETANIP